MRRPRRSILRVLPLHAPGSVHRPRESISDRDAASSHTSAAPKNTERGLRGSVTSAAYGRTVHGSRRPRGPREPSDLSRVSLRARSPSRRRALENSAALTSGASTATADPTELQRRPGHVLNCPVAPTIGSTPNAWAEGEGTLVDLDFRLGSPAGVATAPTRPTSTFEATSLHASVVEQRRPFHGVRTLGGNLRRYPPCPLAAAHRARRRSRLTRLDPDPRATPQRSTRVAPVTSQE